MTILELLRPLASHNVQHRGMDYTNRVSRLEGDAQQVSAVVRGTDLYDVTLMWESDSLSIFCSCPYFVDQGRVCKHLWATAILAEQRGWLTQLAGATRVDVDLAQYDFLGDRDDFDPVSRDTHPDFNTASGGANRGQWSRASSVPRVAYPTARAPRPPEPPVWAMALSALTRPAIEERPASTWPDSQLIYVIAAPVGATLTEVPLVIERLERKKNGEWSKPQPARLTLEMIPHLHDADDRWALSLLNASSAFPRSASSYGYGLNSQALGPSYLRSPMVDLLLPRLCATNRVRLRHVAGPYGQSVRAEEDVTLAWDDGEPWHFELVVRSVEESNGDTYQVDGFLRRGEEQASIRDFALLTDSIAVRDGMAARFDAAGGLAWATQLRQRGALGIPADSSRELLNALAHSDIQHLELPEPLRWHERSTTPRFRITIGPPYRYNGVCPVMVEVEYDAMRALIDGSTRLVSDDGRVVYRRDAEAEHRPRIASSRLSRYP